MFRLLLIFFISAMSHAVFAQRDDISFKRFTMEMGLSHNEVTDIYCDGRGFIWFSTGWGINRYDGYKMRTFVHTSDSLSLSNNYVFWIRDVAGHLKLIRNGNGYCFYDEYTETFSDANSYISSIGMYEYYENVYVDRNANIWMSNDKSTHVYSTVGKCYLDSIQTGLLVPSPIVAFSENDSVVVALCLDGSICSFLSHDINHPSVVKSPDGYQFNRIFVDSDGDYWLIAFNVPGLWYYDSKTLKWHHCTSSSRSLFDVPEFTINGLAEDGYHRIWIASDHGGVNIIDKHTRKSVHVLSDKNDNRSLLSNSVKCIYNDRNGNMWVGDNRDGVSLYNESLFKFDIDLLDSDGIDEDFVAHVNTIERDGHGNMWYGTDGSGLLRVDGQTGRTRLYRNVPGDSGSLPGDVIVDLLADSRGTLWIGSYFGGLSRLDGDVLYSYKGRKDVPQAVSFEHVWSIAEDAHHNIWIGALGLGIVVYNPSTETWTEYRNLTGDNSSDYIMQIFPTADGRVYVASAMGVLIFDPILKKFSPLVTTDGNRFYENINDIIVDSRGLLWIGARSGLSVVDTKSLKMIAKFSTATGLPHDVVTSIVEDSERNVWVTTTSGITNVIVSTNPRTSEYSFDTYNYNDKDGFLGGTLNARSIKRVSSGEIYVGGDPGVCRFKPSSIVYNHIVPSVCFTDIAVFGQSVDIGRNSNGHVVTERAMPYSDHVVLDYTENMFTVSFSTLSVILPEKVVFSYMLEGFNDKWIQTDGNSATYTNLAPGTYTLKVVASNCDGFVSSRATELVITILPPLWRTLWAYIAYSVILGLLVWFVYWQIRRREHDRFRLKQIEAEIAKKHEVDDMKLNFFTNVSHELRTPLSLIISPLDNLIASTTDGALRQKLLLIHRNADKLLNMVNQLLDFRKADANAMQLLLTYGDIVSFVRQCGESFRDLSEKNISYSFRSNSTSIYTRFDRDKMSKIVNNLLSNAFKFTPEGGRISLEVDSSSDGQLVEIRVADTGIGISDDYKEHIFERFYQVPGQDDVYAGSGIGLHLVKDFVLMHDGSVSVDDNDGGGTIFVVRIPVVADAPDTVDADEQVLERDRNLVMIVDDNVDFLTLLNDTLEGSYDVVKAHNGQEALSKIQTLLPDLVITDIMMPVMDGNELCRKIKSDVRISHIPVIMLTAKAAEEHKIEGLENGADDYLTKPFNTQILRLKVDRLVDLGHKRHETFKCQIDPEPSMITITSLDEQLIQKAIKYVEDNISRSDLSVEELSKVLGMSRVHLYKKLMSITGRSPIEFIRVLRLKRAAKLLCDKQQNISDVAYAVGFNNPKYFSRYFKDEFGELPSVFQSKSDGIPTKISIDNVVE